VKGEKGKEGVLHLFPHTQILEAGVEGKEKRGGKSRRRSCAAPLLGIGGGGEEKGGGGGGGAALLSRSRPPPRAQSSKVGRKKGGIMDTSSLPPVYTRSEIFEKGEKGFDDLAPLGIMPSAKKKKRGGVVFSNEKNRLFGEIWGCREEKKA